MYLAMAVLLLHADRVPWIYVDLVDAEVTLSRELWLPECKFYPFLFILINVEVEAPVLYQVVIQRFYMAFSTMTIWAIFYATKIFYYMFYGQDLYIEVGALQYMDLDSNKPGYFGFSLCRLLF